MTDALKLPRAVGILADRSYPKREWIHHLVQQLKPKSVVVTTTGGVEHFLEKTVERRGDLYFKCFGIEDWEETLSRRKQEQLRDWMFLQYMNHLHGCVIVFPQVFESAYGEGFSKRINDLVITAYTINVPVEIIAREE